PAFDHQAIATALSKAIGDSVDAKKLPFDSIEVVGKAASKGALSEFRVSVAGKDYVCTIEPAECSGATNATPGLLVSPDGRWAAFTRDGNLWLRDLKNDQERALTDDGEAHFGYGITPDGWKAAFIPRRR